MRKEDILIVASCLVLLFVWFTRFSTIPPPVPAGEGGSATSEAVKANASVEEDAAFRTANPISASDPLPTDKKQDQILPAEVSEYFTLSPAAPITFGIEGKMDITIDPEKGGIVDVVLFEYKENDRKSPMRLGNSEIPMLDIQDNERKWVFSHARVDEVSSYHLAISRAIVGTAMTLQQRWEIDLDSAHQIKYTAGLKNHGSETLSLNGIHIGCGVMNPLETAAGFMGSGGMDQRVDILNSGDESPKIINIDKITGYDEDDRAKLRGSRVDWIAIENKYFTSLISAEQPFVGCNLFTTPVDESKDGRKDPRLLYGFAYLPKTNIKAQEERVWEFDCFIGPKNYDLFKDLGQNKQSILNFDQFLLFHFEWMKAISLGIFWSLRKLEGVFHSYGIAIIIITIVIRMIFWPITHKSTIWSKKMQKIQPLAQELREKYKSDPQKMQQKTMELYREHKINPVSGCLPMFLQIPVFFALFNVLRGAIELRHAGFLWAHDLSQQDTIYTLPGIDIPINPLAVLMGITMFWQQKIIPSSPDPVQQKVMMFMTVFFVIILYGMPSGLTLYWTINQLISILQYKVTHQVTNDTK